MAEQPARDGCILDCFVVERMHLRVKGIADHVQNTVRFERPVLSGVVNIMARHCDECAQHGIIGNVEIWPGAPNIVVSDKMVYFSLLVMLAQWLRKYTPGRYMPVWRSGLVQMPTGLPHVISCGRRQQIDKLKQG